MQETVAQLGHNYGEGVVTTAPTCTEKGVKTFTCDTCGDTKTEDVAATGHTYKNYTSNDDDLETGTCTCGATHTRVKTGAVSDTDKTVTVAPEVTAEEKTDSVTIGKDLLDSIAKDDKGLALHLNSDILELIFNNDALNSVVEQNTDASEISLVVEDKTEITDGAETADSLLFDVYLMIDGDAQASTDFTGGDETSGAKVEVKIPLGMLGSLKNKNVKVYWLEYENGSLKEKHDMGGTLDTEKNIFTFETTHFTEYQVVTEDTAPSVVVTPPANGTTISHKLTETETGWNLNLSAADDTKTYVYLVKYTDANDVVSEKIAKADGKYTDGDFPIPADAKSVKVESVLRGDVTCDGNIKAGDYRKLKDYLTGKINLETLGELGAFAGDATGDGNIKAGDYRKIKDYLTGSLVKL